MTPVTNVEVGYVSCTYPPPLAGTVKARAIDSDVLEPGTGSVLIALTAAFAVSLMVPPLSASALAPVTSIHEAASLSAIV